jgi:hypothetical protein
VKDFHKHRILARDARTLERVLNGARDVLSGLAGPNRPAVA